MRVLIIERNLLWSSRLANSVRGLGHEAQVVDVAPDELDADVAIINLAEPDMDAISRLNARSIKIVAHAGHKEKERLAHGRSAGCELVVTNSELTFKLEEILARAV